MNLLARNLRFLWLMVRLMRCLVNWREVWRCYISGQAPPPLLLRSGIRLHHGPADAPVLMLFEVFSDGCYRRFKGHRQPRTMIDIGANIGAATLDWAHRAKQLEVHAYEPNPSTREVLCENFRRNGFEHRVRVFGEAVGRSCSQAKLWTNVPSVASTCYGDHSPYKEAVQVDVLVVDLNRCWDRMNGRSIDLLKIDAEGAEADILEGADVATLSAIRNVVLEYHTDIVPDCDQRCGRVLQHAGFKCRVNPTGPNRGMLYGWRVE